MSALWGPPVPWELEWQRKIPLEVCSHLPRESVLLVSLSFSLHCCKGKAWGYICWFQLLVMLSKRWLWSSQEMLAMHVAFCGLLGYFPWRGIGRMLCILERGNNPVKKQQHWSCATFAVLLYATLSCTNTRESTEQFPATRSLSCIWQIAFTRCWLCLRLPLSWGWKLQQPYKLDPPPI